ncbi:MAG: SPOR domain-containing protein [Xanthomonadales bacterium]|nr:SPOR domain-containing protein [Xanthomonadales bacterium]
MDPALKQRLIGAAVLVALVVIFVPMLLDRPRSPEPRTIPLEIPQAPDRRLETRVIEVERDARRDPGPLPAVPAAPEEEVASRRLEVAPRPDALTGEDTAGRGAPGTAPPPPPPTESAPPPTAGASAAPPPDAPPAADGRFMVAFGSFAQRANAEKVAAELRRRGIEPVLDQTGSEGRTLTRVRAGPFALRADAERVRLAARDLAGIRPVVQELAEPLPAALRPAPAAGFAVQVGVFSREENALALRDRLRGEGFSAWVETVRGESTAWRVRVGPEAERPAAERLQRALRERLGLQGLIVAHP